MYWIRGSVRFKGLVLLVPEHKEQSWEFIEPRKSNCDISTLTIGHP
jgi:hypothetical protein